MVWGRVKKGTGNEDLRLRNPMKLSDGSRIMVMVNEMVRLAFRVIIEAIISRT